MSEQTGSANVHACMLDIPDLLDVLKGQYEVESTLAIRNDGINERFFQNINAIFDALIDLSQTRPNADVARFIGPVQKATGTLMDLNAQRIASDEVREQHRLVLWRAILAELVERGRKV